MKRNMNNALWSDCETLEEKVLFLRLGRGSFTGIIDKAIENDLATQLEELVDTKEQLAHQKRMVDAFAKKCHHNICFDEFWADVKMSINQWKDWANEQAKENK